MLTDKFTLEQQGRIVIATIDTPMLTSPEAAELVEQLHDRMRCHGATGFALDMSGVEFIDSSCIGALVTFLQTLEHVGGRVALAGCHPNVAFIFQTTRLDSVFILHDDIHHAVVDLETE